MNRSLVAGLGILCLLGVALAVLSVAGVSKLRSQVAAPRPPLAIAADWEAARALMPTYTGYQRPPNSLVRILQAAASPARTDADVAALTLWLEQDGVFPKPGCSSLQGFGATPSFSMVTVFEAAEGLGEHGYPEHQVMLARAVADQELLGLAISIAILEDAAASIDIEAFKPPVEAAFDGLARSAACGDRVMVGLLDGTLSDPRFGLMGLAELQIDQLYYRDWSARLLLTLDPLRSDPAAMAAALDAFEVPSDNGRVSHWLAETSLDNAKRTLKDLEAL